jgi:lipopolysaccharide export system permease protein
MKYVDRLVWRELFGPLVSSVLMFLMLLFTSAYLIKLTDLMVQGAPFSVVAKVGFYSLPLLITQTLPMGLLLGTLLAFGRLSGDSEHIALYACGVSFYRIARPVAVTGLVVGVLAIVWNETVVPPATSEMYRLQQTVVETIKATDRPLHYVDKKKDSEKVDIVVIIDGGYDVRSRMLRRVTIIKMSDEKPGLPDVVVYADRAVARDAKGLDWEFFDAYVKYLRPDPESTVQADTYFKVLRTLPKGVSLERDFKGILQAEVTDNRRMTFVQLRDKIREERAQGDPARVADGDEFDLWSKVSLPLASLIFGLVAAPLGIRPHRGSKTMGFGIAIGLIFCYWVVHNWMFQVAKGGSMQPLSAAFTADFIGLLAAVYLMYRTRQ